MKSFRIPLELANAKAAIWKLYCDQIYERDRRPEYNAHVERVIDAVARALVAPREGRFGIMLLGGVGNGKTTMMRAIRKFFVVAEAKKLIPHGFFGQRNNESFGMRFARAVDIAAAMREDPARYKVYCTCDALAIDDLGQEPQSIVDYGTVKRPLEDLLCSRYDARLYTLITTNLAPAMIRPTYHDRVADRLNEWMTPVIFGDGNSFRDVDADGDGDQQDNNDNNQQQQ